MLPYLIIFGISIYAYKCAIRPVSLNVRFFCIFICILLPSLLAGIRDESLGIDWPLGYGRIIWDSAVCSQNFFDLRASFVNAEFFYVFFNYLIAHVFSDCHFFFFFHQLLLITIATFIAFRYRKYGFSEIILLFYFLYIYNTSFNILRQSIAMMFFFGAVSLWGNNKKKGSMLCSFFAVISHTSAIFSILYFPFLKMKFFLEEKRKLVTMVLIVISFFVVATFSSILRSFIDMGIFSDHYDAYVNQIGEVKSHKIEIVFLLSVIGSLFVFTSQENRNEPIFTQIYFLALIALLFQFFGNITDVAFRVAHYFVIPIAIFLPRISLNRLESQKVCQAFLFLLFLRFCYNVCFVNGAENTVPYTSYILGI